MSAPLYARIQRVAAANREFGITLRSLVEQDHNNPVMRRSEVYDLVAEVLDELAEALITL